MNADRSRAFISYLRASAFICGSLISGISHRLHDSFSRCRPCGKESSERADDRGEDQAGDDRVRADMKLEGRFTEGSETADAGGEAVHRKGEQHADDSTEQREADRFEHERPEDGPAPEAERAERADLLRATRNCG